MPKTTNTHATLTVNRPITVAGVRFRPDARYTITAAMLDKIKAEAPEAVAKAAPISKE